MYVQVFCLNETRAGVLAFEDFFATPLIYSEDKTFSTGQLFAVPSTRLRSETPIALYKQCLDLSLFRKLFASGGEGKRPLWRRYSFTLHYCTMLVNTFLQCLTQSGRKYRVLTERIT